jgi:hypothetical protein
VEKGEERESPHIPFRIQAQRAWWVLCLKLDNFGSVSVETCSDSVFSHTTPGIRGTKPIPCRGKIKKSALPKECR